MKKIRSFMCFIIIAAICSIYLPAIAVVTTATGAETITYGDFSIHLNEGDTFDDENGTILWNSPGSASDPDKVTNNRYIELVPSVSGEVSIIFQADALGQKKNNGTYNMPRMYIESADSIESVTKVTAEANGSKAQAEAINTDTTLKTNVVAGRTYYIFPFCYGNSSSKFTVSELKLESKEVIPVTDINVQYKSGGTVVAERNVEIGDGHYVGDSYAYISTAYIKGTDNKIYSVGMDNYVNYRQTYAVSDSNGGINKEIKKSVTLSEETVIEYDVKETDIVFYDEFENLLSNGLGSFSNGRYWASGGTMAAINGTYEFYPVTEAGYYTVIFMGAGNNNGTEIFKNKTAADAATAFGTSPIGIKYNNSAYGLYSSYTVYLDTTDNLTIKNYSGTDAVDYVVIRSAEAEEIAVSVNGPDGITAGNTAQFELVTDLKEIPSWSVSGVEGVIIDNSGVLTASDDSASGIATVTVSFNNGAINVTKQVQVGSFEIGDARFEGTEAVNIGEEKMYKITSVRDQFGNDIEEYAVTYSSSDTDILQIDETTGEAKSLSKGDVEIIATVSVGTVSKEFRKTVRSDNYSIIAEAEGDSTEVDISDITVSDSITGYTVTTADENGNKVSQYTIDSVLKGGQTVVNEDAVVIYAEYDSKTGALKKAEVVNDVKAGSILSEHEGTKMFVWSSFEEMRPASVIKTESTSSVITVNTAGASKVEVSPIYTYNYDPETDEARADVMLLPDRFAEGDYGFEITKVAENQYKAIYDLYINGAMIGNNVNEKGIGREFTKGDELTYTVRDITVDGGSIELEKDDFYSLSDTTRMKTPIENRGISKIVVTKEATIADRNQKVYILGDSLVAIYYGEPVGGYTTDGLVGTARIGWGQLIHNFINDDVDIVNLANSGQWASGLQETAFTCVMQSAREGDYMILEAGWNDVSYSSKSEMKQAIIEMTEACEAKGVIPVLVTPNSSAQTFSDKEDTQYAEVMREAAGEMQAKYNDVIFVDLADLSYQFLNATYGTDTDAMTKSINLDYAGTSSVTNEKGDMLHLSYLGAMKYAELVAQSMSDQGVEFINKDFTWSIEDKSGNTISVQVK